MRRIFCMLMISALIMGSVSLSLNGEEIKRTKAEQEVLEVLKKFQAGYTARDVAKLDEYIADIYDPDDCLVIGTGSLSPKSGEWGEGIEKIKKLVKFDWEHWDDLKMNVDEARIRVKGDTAWVAMWGTSEGKKDKTKEYKRILQTIGRIIERYKDDESEEMTLTVMLYVLKRAAIYIERYVPEGDEYTFPIRVTTVLKKKKGKWLIQLMHYAFPIKDIPNVRI